MNNNNNVVFNNNNYFNYNYNNYDNKSNITILIK